MDRNPCAFQFSVPSTDEIKQKFPCDTAHCSMLTYRLSASWSPFVCHYTPPATSGKGWEPLIGFMERQNKIHSGNIGHFTMLMEWQLAKDLLLI